MGLSDATIESKWLFQFSFCAVSLAIVWGTTLERIKFGVYVIYAVVFAGLIYPIGSHWVFGGGWLQNNLGMQDFAGSTAVHLIGATGALAALLLLGPRRGQVRRRRQAAGDPRAQHAAVRPRRADPVARLVRVQPGLDAGRARRPLPRGGDGHPAGGRRGRAVLDPHRLLEDQGDRHRHGRQRRDRRAGGDHRAVGLRRAVGRRDHRRDRRRDRPARRLRDRQEDRRPGGRADGARPVRRLGHAGVRVLHVAAAGRVQRVRRAGPALQRLVPAARHAGAGRRDRLRLRVLAVVPDVLRDQEDVRAARVRRRGGSRPRHHRARHVRLPEQFIPAPELIGYATAPRGSRDIPSPSRPVQEVPAT